MTSIAAGENPLVHDLEDVLAHTQGIWEALRGQNLFVTGGTGFFGRWLLETFAHANETLGLRARVVVLSRNPENFRARAPQLARDPSIQFVSGDVRRLSAREMRSQAASLPEKYGFFIHAGTESNSNLNTEDPLQMLETIVQGTRRALDFARENGARRFLFLSSGAVYGKQPAGMSAIPETYPGGPDPVYSAYAEGKRAAELLCADYARQHAIEPVIARCFSFYGPHLPLDTHQAMGNFIRDAMEGGPIRVKGDGTAQRSYLYAADLAAWLWTLLLTGKSERVYNVGSSSSASIAEWARRVAAVLAPSARVEIARAPGAGEDIYVPSIERARKELGLAEWTSPQEGLRRMGQWLARSALARKPVSS